MKIRSEQTVDERGAQVAERWKRSHQAAKATRMREAKASVRRWRSDVGLRLLDEFLGSANCSVPSKLRELLAG